MVDRVHTPDGLGTVQEVERRQGRTWINVAGRGFSGWYLSHEVTADIGDHNVVNLDDLPDRDEGTILPWDPEARDTFHNQLTIQPTAELPENLSDTPSIKGLRNYDPVKVFGHKGHGEKRNDDGEWDSGYGDNAWDDDADQQTVNNDTDDAFDAIDNADRWSSYSSYSLFGRTPHARHLHAGTTDVEDLPDESDQIPSSDSDAYQQVPSSWKSKQPGLDDYGPHYDEINDYQRGRDGPFDTGGKSSAYLADTHEHFRGEHGHDDPYAGLAPKDYADAYNRDHPLPPSRDHSPHGGDGGDADSFADRFNQEHQNGQSHHEITPDEMESMGGDMEGVAREFMRQNPHHVVKMHPDGSGFSVRHKLFPTMPWNKNKESTVDDTHHIRLVAAGPEFDGDPGTFERTQDSVAAPGDDNPFEDFAVEQHPNDPRESSTQYQVTTTGDGYVVTSETGAQMSRFYATEGEAVHHARFAAYEEFLDRDPMARQAAWADVRKKAVRLRKEGAVHVSYYEPKQIQAMVTGDNGTYDTAVSRKNAFGNGVTYYDCSCPWGQWAFKRQYTYVGRFCSHGLAAYHEMQSLDNKGIRSFNEDQNPFVHQTGSTDLGTFTQHIGSTQHEAFDSDFPDQGPSQQMRDFFSWLEDNGQKSPDRPGGAGRPQGPGRMPGPEDVDYPSLIKQYCQARNADPSQLMQEVGDYFDDGAYMNAMGSRYADVSMLGDDPGGDYADGSDLMPARGVPAQAGPLQPVGMDPSHTVDPANGDMQVFSDPMPPTSNNDNDPYGRSLDQQQGGGGVIDGVLNALTGGGSMEDPLQGVEVAHQPDGDVAMEGIEVAHGGMPDLGDGDQNGYANPGEDSSGIDPSAMMGGMPQMGQPGDSDIAQMAQQFLAKTSAKNYSLREQEELMHEKGSARQFGDLNTANSLYEEPRSFLDM